MVDKKKDMFDCPLLKKLIPEGYCIDLNYERLGYFKGSEIKNVKKITNLSLEEIANICDNCRNFPMEDDQNSE